MSDFVREAVVQLNEGVALRRAIRRQKIFSGILFIACTCYWLLDFDGPLSRRIGLSLVCFIFAFIHFRSRTQEIMINGLIASLSEQIRKSPSTADE